VGAMLANGDSLYAGTNGAGVYRSNDGGQSWTRASNGLPGNGGVVPALLARGSHLYAGTGNGVYRSTDGAESWTRASDGLTGPASSVFSLAASGSSLYAGTGN